MDDGGGQEEYIRQVLEAYRKTPGTMGPVRRPDRVLAAQLYQRGVSVSVIENALVLAATRRLIRPTNAPPLGTVRSLAYFLPVIRGSARPEGRSRLLPISAPQARTHRAPTVARQVIRHQPTMHALRADDGKAPRTPAAWMILLVSLLPKKHAYGADDGPPTFRSRSQSRSRRGSLRPRTAGSLLPRAEEKDKATVVIDAPVGSEEHTSELQSLRHL